MLFSCLNFQVFISDTNLQTEPISLFGGYGIGFLEMVLENYKMAISRSWGKIREEDKDFLSWAFEIEPDEWDVAVFFRLIVNQFDDSLNGSS